MTRLIVNGPQKVAIKTTGFVGQPIGEIELTENHTTYNVKPYASAKVDVPDPVLIDKTISHNGEYLASEDNADGYKQVDVDVQPSLATKVITKNGTYRASDDGVQGYSDVTVGLLFEAKTVTPSTSQQTIVPDAPYQALSQVTVNPTPLEKLTITPTTEQQIVTPSAPAIGFKSVTVEGYDLIEKTITENGTYQASSDNADGYSGVNVNVPNLLDELLGGRITYVKTDEACVIPNVSSGSNNSFENLVFWSSKNAIAMAGGFSRLQNPRYINCGKTSGFEGYLFYYNIGIKTLIILSNTVIPCSYYTFLGSSFVSGTAYAYVFDTLKASYQSATNWSAYASQIRGFSDAPAYDNTVTYEIGDVCTYNGKFYGYCKSDLTSSTGNPPSGTTDDNTYWEYVADLGV